MDPPARGFLCQTDNSQGCDALRDNNQSSAITTPQQNVYVNFNDYQDYTRSLPDGRICSANAANTKLDLPANYWARKAITPNENGEIPIIYYFTRHHTTDHIRYYITKNETDNMQAIKWSDLVEIAHYPAVAQPGNGEFVQWRETVKLPQGTSGKHTIVSMWPVARSHGTSENFVSCSDVDIQGSENPEQGWGAIGNGVQAQQNLKAGDKVTFRLFSNGDSAGDFTHEIAEDQWGSAANWLYDLARKVNQQNMPVKIGDTLENGQVKITSVKNNYNVYAIDKSKNYNYTIDVKAVEKPGTGTPPLAVITPSTTTITHNNWVNLGADQSQDADGTPVHQLDFVWSVERNADKVELESDRGIATRVRLKAAATEDFDVVVQLKATDPENNSGETTLVLNAKKEVVEQPGGSWDKNKTYATPCNKVTWNGAEWMNGWWTQNNQPGADGEWGVWRKVGDSRMHAMCKGAK
ncbi:lytic polysaccharide monooxygenase [Erwiniaceae bacterium BAC15a-03b]|uniref:Lytic polysaccharide monooxygenase n=1 Tax=Winslowiella arboricola TaxID=2978220 RepID=A0A9J6PRJ8_9GAMM|nr:lytic polysaccharide monooxygenase [Winslowiella arboricola]MCU5772727.1 lytic polysaccharide monooxygenase [Winslowiella arboricola]MCU5778277.1 lytic polysaccharide monooxygenase [Winslowiella arboricola]